MCSQKRGGYGSLASLANFSGDCYAYHNGLHAKIGLHGAILFEYYLYQDDKAKTWPQPALSDAISML